VKLGIVVVYLVSERMVPLLELHLRKIEELTDVPYTIYGSVNRLLPRHRRVLERHPRVETFEISPSFEERDQSAGFVKENGYYLDHLIELAITDGVTHLCALHVDSFPIRAGWVEHVLAKIDDAHPMAAMLREENGDTVLPMPAFLFCTREFQELVRPRFMIPSQTEATPEWQAFCKRYGGEQDTGLGYAFALNQRGLRFHALRRSNQHDDHYLLAGVYDDLVFHLGAAARMDLAGQRVLFRGERRGAGRTAEYMAAETDEERQRLLELGELENRRKFEEIWAALTRDPDAYVHLLRTGETPRPAHRS